MPHKGYTNEEIARRGREIYEREIRARVTPEQNGKFLVVDIETGEYEIDDQDIDAIQRIKARRVEAVLYVMRIGQPAAYRIGAHILGEAR